MDSFGQTLRKDHGNYDDGVAFVNGQFVPIAQACVPILDWGFLRSDATYDVVHVWEGSFFRLEDHLDRFERSMDKLHLHPPHERAEIREVLFECVRLTGFRRAYVEMICTRGMPPYGSRDPRECVNKFFAFALPFIWIADPEKQKVGLHATVSHVQRIQPESVDPTVKNYHWLDLIAGLFSAYERDGETTILVDSENNIVEGPGFNVFVVKDGMLATPDRGVLEGVTRKVVVELAEKLGIPIDKRAIPVDEVQEVDEIFGTSTAGGIIPLTKINGKIVGDGQPGYVTQILHQEYWTLHYNQRAVSPIDYYL